MVGQLVVSLEDDHLAVRLDTPASLISFTGSFVVPFSTIAAVEVVRPAIPGAFDQWLHGLHLPSVVAKGRFITWSGFRRFLWLERRTRWALRVKLSSHESYDEIVVGVVDPEGLAEAIEKKRTAK